MPSRTSGALAVRSRATNAARIAATPTSEPSVRAESQPASGASTSVKTSSSIPAVMLTAPAMSNAPAARRAGWSFGTRRTPAISVTSATGAGRKKTQRQPISVSRPPITSPSENPVAPVAVKIESALLRAGPSREARGDDRERRGRRERRAHALDEAHHDQHGPVGREPAEHGRDDEDAERDQEDAPPSEQVGRAAAEQQEAAVAEHVRADDPLQRARRHVEVGADRRERDAHHRDVERVEEERAAEHEQGAPGASREFVGGAERRRCECAMKTRISSFALLFDGHRT